MRKKEDQLDMAGLAVGLGSLLLPPLLKAVGLGGRGRTRGRGRMATILGRGGVKGMKWGVRRCRRCHTRHRCVGRTARGRRRHKRRKVMKVKLPAFTKLRRSKRLRR